VTNLEVPLSDKAAAESALINAFSPHAPIRTAALFRGRNQQIREVIDAVRSEGLHVVIYGERGVGKTSLANIIADILRGAVSASRVACGQTDTFSSVMKRATSGIQLFMPQARVGFNADSDKRQFSLLEAMSEADEWSPDELAGVLEALNLPLVFIIDEFDRLPKTQAPAFADLMKALSDRHTLATVVLVGVAEDIGELLQGHASIERNLRQIHLPRMSETELGEIVDSGMAMAGFTLSGSQPQQRIIVASQGFPHYTHSLALNAARAALDDDRRIVNDDDVVRGMAEAVRRADQSHRDLYHKASTGTRAKNLWREVVASCAIAAHDERGYFSSRAVQDALGQLLRRPVKQQAVASFLGKLIEEDRGPLLQRIGPERRYRYRFVNPLMRPFILMKAMDEGLLRVDG
jgi:Cdc6-like AAA superfamily ATPase